MPVKDRRSLVEADIARALTRKHKRCKDHGDVQVVCLACARVFCPQCSVNCPRCMTPADIPEQKTKTKGTKSAFAI